MKLTKRDKQALLRATELILTGQELFSCNAITEATGAGALAAQYAEFYDHYRTYGVFWLWADPDFMRMHVDDEQAWRAILILWFREVGPDGILETKRKRGSRAIK